MRTCVGSMGAWVHRWWGGCGSIKCWCGSKKKHKWCGSRFWPRGVGLKRFVKKLLLKVLQNLQESTCAEVSF